MASRREEMVAAAGAVGRSIPGGLAGSDEHPQKITTIKPNFPKPNPNKPTPPKQPPPHTTTSCDHPRAGAETGQPDRDSECALLYTSGTTARPKGCVCRTNIFLYAGNWYAQRRRADHAA